MLYSYRPLERDDNIRLVEIQPGLYTSETIQCEIIHTCRANPSIKYEAISCTWGDTSPLKSIFIGVSYEFQVTRNCYDVLRRFRKPDAKRLIWIDALCVNQKDDEERIRQVRKMGEIYENASQVLVYLGEADDSSTRVFRRVIEVCQTDIVNHLYLTSNAISPIDTDLVKAKRKLIRRPWFTRVWVLQEVFNGFGGITVVCGTEAVFWDQLASFYNAVAEDYPDYSRDMPYVLQIGSGNERRNLFQLLCLTRYADATDPRDKYFGIVSMVLDVEDSQLLARYNQSTTIVYTEIGLHLIKHYGLQLLRAVRHPHSRYSALASWIPDWSRRDDNDPYWTDQFSVRAEYGYGVEHRVLDCCKENESGHSYHPVLSATGYRAGRIKSLGEVLAFENHSFLAILRRLWYSDRIKNETSYIPQDFTGKLEKDDYTRICLRGHDFRWLQKDVQKLEGSIHNCRLFLDEDNNLGLAPSETSVGDFIYIIEGAPEPCLLRQRPKGGWFLVSGECYFQDMVDINQEENLEAYLPKQENVDFGKESLEIW